MSESEYDSDESTGLEPPPLPVEDSASEEGWRDGEDVSSVDGCGVGGEESGGDGSGEESGGGGSGGGGEADTVESEGEHMHEASSDGSVGAEVREEEEDWEGDGNGLPGEKTEQKEEGDWEGDGSGRSGEKAEQEEEGDWEGEGSGWSGEKAEQEEGDWEGDGSGISGEKAEQEEGDHKGGFQISEPATSSSKTSAEPDLDLNEESDDGDVINAALSAAQQVVNFLKDSGSEEEGGEEVVEGEQEKKGVLVERSREQQGGLSESAAMDDVFGGSDDEEEEGQHWEEGSKRGREDDDEAERVPAKKRRIISDDSEDEGVREEREEGVREEGEEREEHVSEEREEEEMGGDEEVEELGAEVAELQEGEGGAVGGEVEMGGDGGDVSDGSDGLDPSTSGVSDWDLMMARRKEAMSRVRKRRRKDIDITANEDHIVAMIRDMHHVAEEDRQLNLERKTAAKKLHMLPSVIAHLKKADLQTTFIECGILSSLADWLTPLPDHSLPHLKIRESILDILRSYPIPSSDLLKSSKVGKSVMLLYRHPKETRRNREKAGKLINNWARPIFGLASDFKTLSRDEREERDYANLSQAARRRLSSGGESRKARDDDFEAQKPGDKGWVGRARVPMPSTRDYVVRPKWNVEHEFKKRASKKELNRYEKQLVKQKKKKTANKQVHAVGISVEGRKMPL